MPLWHDHHVSAQAQRAAQTRIVDRNLEIDPAEAARLPFDLEGFIAAFVPHAAIDGIRTADAQAHAHAGGNIVRQAVAFAVDDRNL